MPDEILAEVSRLAQEFNVPRAEIFRRAIGALAEKQGLLDDLGRLREINAEIEAAKSELAARFEAEKARAEEKTRELEDIKSRTASADEDSRRILETMDRLRRELAEKEREREKLSGRLTALRRRVENLGHTLAERTYLAVRSLEVERLRERLGKSVARMFEAEKRGRASEGAAARMAGRSARLMNRLKAAETKRSELAGQYAAQKEEMNKRERDIGQLRRELEAARGELKTLIKLLGGVSAPAEP